MKQYSIEWAYPSSTHATQAGFARTGCYVVEVRNHACDLPKLVKGFVSDQEAEAELAKLKARQERFL